MTTDVQIGRNRLHLQLLSMVISRTASWLGMSRGDIQEMEDAVGQACLFAMGMSGDEVDTPINVRVSAAASCVTVDIMDPCICCMPIHAGEYADDGSGGMAQIGCQVDSIELISGHDCTTIRIIKRARKAETVPPVTAAYLTTSLQS